ncbi:glucose-6-phosphate dehydrogenase assembly protein OpcA [Polyangium aurulentum]|uniref:glucose-6-phosphate dehydrogenase assembly protein OpcA n=1 Tax=Polyangium aurulentum TaxID=2567896 RepID=UPI001F256ADF|nr:glucose-6-phosphate dehydrogenase assembly protein OpcA [Polyangium aurulentum]
MTVLPVGDAVGRIENELTTFWSSPDEQTGSPMTKVRASTMSFVLSVAASEMPRANETTDKLADTHPGRAFLLAMDGRLAPWEVSYEVRAECRLQGEADPICHDWIEMTFGAMAAERAASVLSALVLPEVPVVAEIGRGAPRTLVNAVVPRADRIIVDSAHTSPARIAEIARATNAPLGDRQFVRTYSWRDLVARFFDDAVGALGSIRSITVGRTPGGATDPAALVIGWLGSRLGWSFEARDRARSAGGEAIAIALRDEPREDLEQGQITGIWIETALGGEPLSLACARCKSARTLYWKCEGARSSAHEVPLGYRDEDWVLVKAIDATEGDRVYRQAILAAADWSGR